MESVKDVDFSLRVSFDGLKAIICSEHASLVFVLRSIYSIFSVKYVRIDIVELVHCYKC